MQLVPASPTQLRLQLMISGLKLLFVNSSYILYMCVNMHALVLVHTCAHASIVAHMDLHAHHRNSHTLKCTVHFAQTRWLNLSGTHTHKHMPFIKLLLCRVVQATDLMHQLLVNYQLLVNCCTYPLCKYSF